MHILLVSLMVAGIAVLLLLLPVLALQLLLRLVGPSAGRRPRAARDWRAPVEETPELPTSVVELLRLAR